MGMPGPEPRPGPHSPKMHPALPAPCGSPEQPQQCGKARCPQTGPAPCTPQRQSGPPCGSAAERPTPARAAKPQPTPAAAPAARRRNLSRSPPQRNAARRAPAAPAHRNRRAHRGAPRSQPATRVNREPREEDPGLEMISRRYPPKQKFANFEEYMAARRELPPPLRAKVRYRSWCQSSTCCPFRRKIWFRRRMTNDPAGGSGPALPGVRRRIDAAGNLAALPPGPQL